MMTNVSSGPTKYKLLLTDTGQADNATGGQAKGAGWDMRGTDCGWAETWGELTWGKWNGLRHKGNWLGTNEAGWDMRANVMGWDMRGTDWGQMGQAETWGELTGVKEKWGTMPKTSLLVDCWYVFVQTNWWLQWPDWCTRRCLPVTTTLCCCKIISHAI